MTSSFDKSEELWKKAVEALHPSTRDQLNASRSKKLDVVGSVLKVAEAKRDLTLRKRWKVKKPNGEEIIVRDVLEKIVSWIHRFRDIGDIAVQYSPVCASLPWAAIRFVLQAAVSERELFGSYVEGLELVTRLVVRFREFEKLFLQPSSSSSQIEEALVRLYTAVLEYLAEAVAFFGKSTASRLLQSPFHKPDDELVDRILKHESEVLKLSDLVQVQQLLAIEKHVNRLQIRSEESQKLLSKEQHSALLRWLSPVPYLRHHQDHQTTRVQDTGDWLLQDPLYQTWATSSASSIFLLSGIAGSGKTKVCSTVVDQFYQPSPSARLRQAPVAFFYCAESSFEPERCSSVGVLKSLVRQLATRTLPKPSVHQSISILYEKKEAEAEGFDLATMSASECVAIILEVLEDNPAYLMVDAIDELTEPSEILDALSEIQIRARNVVKVFVTSRDISRISAMMPQSASRLRIKPGLNAVDVRSFAIREVGVAKHTRKLLLGDFPDDLEQQLVDSLCSGADEMFLWIKLRMDQLTRLRNEEDLRNALNCSDVPTIDELFQKTVDSILGGGEVALNLATRAFAWLLYMREPLSPDVFRSAISPGTPAVELGVLLNVCHNSIYLDTSLQVFRFAHHSVQQYLRDQPFLAVTLSQQILASSCLSVCSAGPPEVVTLASPKDRLYDYAAMYWGYHWAALDPSWNTETSNDGLQDFLFSNGGQLGPAGYAWMEHVRATYESLPWDHPEQIPYSVVIHDERSPFLPSCVYGLNHVVRDYPWPENFDFDQKNAFGQTALYLASFFGHRDVVEFLLDRNVDVNIHCGKYGSPLHCAAFRGHLEISQMLLHHGADPEHGKWKNVIHAAFNGNREELASNLLKYMKLETADQVDDLLQASAEGGFEDVMTWLLQHPLRTADKTDRGLEILTKAINSGKVSNVELIQRIPHLADALPKTGLVNSALRGRTAMTSYLLDHGLDPSIEGELGTPLRCAGLNGHVEVCQILLDRGADVNQQSHTRNVNLGGALHAACMKGHLDVVQVLIQNGAYVDQTGGHYGTPAQAAAFHNHIDILNVLARSGAHFNMPGLYADALCAALDGCSYGAVGFLLDKGLVPRRVHMVTGSRCRGKGKGKLLRNILSSSQRGQPGRKELEPDLAVGHALRKQDCETLAARTGRVDVLDRLLDIYDLTSEYGPDIECILLEAYRCGHIHTVIHLLDRRDFTHKSLQAILRTVATEDDRATFDRVLQRMNELFPGECHDRDAVFISLPSLSIFRAILSSAESRLNNDDFAILLKNCLWIAASECHIQSLTNVLLNDYSFRKEDIVFAFEIACYEGHEAIVSLLYDHLPRDETITEMVLDSIWRTFDERKIGTAIFLHGCLIKAGDILKHASQLVLHASAQGFVEFLEAHFRCSITIGEDALQMALSLAANSCHAATCELLITNGANPNLRSRMPSLKTVGSKVPRKPKDLVRSNRKISSIFVKNSVDRLSEQESQTHGSFTPIEWCLRKFEAHGMHDVNFTETMLFLSRLTDPVSDLTFCRAVSVSPCEVIQSLIEKGADVNAASADSSAMEIAAQREHMQFSIVKLLLDAGYRRDCILNTDEVLLHHSLNRFSGSSKFDFFADTPSLSDVFSTGPGATISFLLQQKILALPRDDRSASYLQCAAAAGEQEIVKMILEHDVDVDSKCGYYGTALQAASANGFLEIVRMLIDAGADPNVVGGHHGTALHAAVCSVNIAVQYSPGSDGLDSSLADVDKKRQIEISLDLIQAGADPNLSSMNKNATLIEACATGCVPLVLALLHAGADVHAVGSDIRCTNPDPYTGRHVSGHRTALHNAIATRNSELVRTLLRYGFDLSTHAANSLPPLVFAADVGCSEILDILLNAMSETALRLSGRALQQAVYKGDLSNIEKFLARREFVDSPANIIDCFKAACEISDVRVLEVLLDRLVLTEEIVQSLEEIMRDPSMKRPQHLAMMLEYVTCPIDLFVRSCRHGWTEAVHTALAQGIDINAEDSKGRVGLQLAAASGELDVVKTLLANGAAVDQTSDKLGTPLLTALESLATNKLFRMYGYRAPEIIVTRMKSIHDLKAEDHQWVREFYDLKDSSSNTRTEQIVETVSLLTSSGADPMSCKGPMGYPVHVAAFQGHMGIFDMIIDERLDLTVRDGFFGTVLAAAVQGDSLEAVKRLVLLSRRSDKEESILGDALIIACRAFQPRSVNFLLSCGAGSNFQSASGNTPFEALMEMSSDSIYWSRAWGDAAPQILALLLGASPPLRTSKHHTGKIIQAFRSSYVRDELLQRLFTKVPHLELATEAAINLIKSFGKGESGLFLDYLFTSGQFPPLNADMLLAANTNLIPQLLEHDSSFVVTSSLIKTLSRSRQESTRFSLNDGTYYNRMFALIKHGSLIPTEDDIVHLCSSAEHHHDSAKKSVLADVLDQNPNLWVTERMLSAARNPADINVLLDRMKPDQELFTEVVFRNAAINGTLDVLLKRYSGRPITRRIVVDGIRRHPPESPQLLERVLVLDPGFAIYEHVMIALFVHRRLSEGLRVLESHRKRFKMTKRVKRVLDTSFYCDRDRDMLLRLYQLADSDSSALLESPNISDSPGQPVAYDCRFDIPLDKPDYPIEDDGA